MDDIFRKLTLVPWELVSTNKEPEKWLMKMIFEKGSYVIALSNLSSVYLEALTTDEIKHRCIELNQRLEAPAEKVLDHIYQTLLNHHDINFNSQLLSDSTLSLSFSNSFYTGIPFCWKFLCTQLSTFNSKFFTKSLLCDPLILTVASLLCENKKLKEIIFQKDNEIKDYRDSGYKVSRPHLKTDLYEEDFFKSNLKQDRNYASVVCKETIHIIAEKSINDEIIHATYNSQSNEVKSNLLSKSKDAVSVASQSPLKRRNKRKLRPAVRGCVLDETDDNNVESCSASTVPSTVFTEPVQEIKKPKKIKRKQLF